MHRSQPCNRERKKERKEGKLEEMIKIPTFLHNLIPTDRRYFLLHSLIASLYLFFLESRPTTKSPGPSAWNEADLDPVFTLFGSVFHANVKVLPRRGSADNFSRNREDSKRRKVPLLPSPLSLSRESRSRSSNIGIFENHRSDLVPESLGIINSNRIINIPYRTTFVNQYVRNNLPRRDWRSSFKDSLVPCHNGGNK